MMLLDELRGKSKNTAFDEMDACLRRFAIMQNKVQEQNKAIHQGPSDSACRGEKETVEST